MKKLLQAIIFFVALGATHAAFSYGVILSAKVVKVRVDSDGRGMVIFDQVVGGAPPGCVIAYYSTAMAFNATTAGGKAIMAMALTAKATGASIVVDGTGVCGHYTAYVEDWSYGEIY
jgi:hypothetical protein